MESNILCEGWVVEMGSADAAQACAIHLTSRIGTNYLPRSLASVTARSSVVEFAFKNAFHVSDIFPVAAVIDAFRIAWDVRSNSVIAKRKRPSYHPTWVFIEDLSLRDQCDHFYPVPILKPPNRWPGAPPSPQRCERDGTFRNGDQVRCGLHTPRVRQAGAKISKR